MIDKESLLAKEDRIDLEESWLLNDAETQYFAKDSNNENQDQNWNPPHKAKHEPAQ